jgi:hypothetical protein
MTNPRIYNRYLKDTLNEKPERVIVFYHGGCHDGLASASVVRLFFKNDCIKVNPSNLYCIPTDYTLNSFDKHLGMITPRTHVFTVDITPPIPVLKRIYEITPRVYIIDHHESAIGKYLDYCVRHLEIPMIGSLVRTVAKNHHIRHILSLKWLASKAGLPEPFFSTHHSGCYLTHQFFHPQKEVPELISMISMYDTRDDSDHGHSTRAQMILGLESDRLDMDPIMKYDKAITDSSIINTYQEKGRVITSYQTKHYAEVLHRHGMFATDPDGELLCILNNTGDVDGLCDYILQRRRVEYVVCYEINSNGTIKLSIRRSAKSTRDVREKLRHFTSEGGGHVNKCAAQLRMDESMYFIDTLLMQGYGNRHNNSMSNPFRLNFEDGACTVLNPNL